MEVQKTAKYKRDTSLDAICGLFIVYMIIGHAFQWAHIEDDDFQVNLSYVFYMFMAWFFYKSGMYHKKEEPKIAIRKYANKLLLPWIIYGAIGEFLYWITCYQNGILSWKPLIAYPIKDIIFQGTMGGNLPLWFLLSLFLVKILMSYCDKYKISHIYVLILGMVISGGGTVAMTNNIPLPFTLFNVPLGISYYVIGFKLKDVQYKRYIFGISLIVFILLSLLIPSFVDFRSDRTIRGYWIFFIISSVAGIIAINNIFKYKIFQLPELCSIGMNSLSYYCLHWIVFYVVFILCNFKSSDIPNYDLLYELMFWSIIILPILTYFRSLIIKRIR